MASSSVHLQSLFGTKEPKKATPQPQKPQPIEVDPSLDDVSVWQVLASQTEYLQKLESANKRFQDESRFLRENLRNLVEDNSRLYGELKGCLAQRIEELADKRDHVASSSERPKLSPQQQQASEEGSEDDDDGEEEGDEPDEEVIDEPKKRSSCCVPSSKPPVRESPERQPKALSNLVRMHASRADRLESEVRALKNQLDSSRLIISELKASARDSSAGSTSGGSVQVDAESMLKLMNERDEAVGRISRLVERLNVCDQHRQALESDLRDALKLVDEAVRDKQVAIDDKMRMGERIAEIERKMEEERESADRRLEQAVKVIRSAASEQIKAAEDKMSLALADSLRHEQKATRLARDQRRLASELEQVRQEAAKFEQELADANSDFKATLARVLADRDIALRELSRMRALTSQERGDLDTDRSRLAEQLRMARSQIADCQQELNAMAADRLQAVGQMNDALAQVEAERRQRAELESEVDAVRRELSAHAQSLKQQHEATGGELRRIVEQQAELIRRLRTECDRLLNGYSSEKSEADRLRAENALLLSRLRRSQEELGAARFDASASAQVQDALRWRMAELDARAKQAKAEVEDILARSHGSLRGIEAASAPPGGIGEISVAVNKTLSALKSDELLGLGSSDADDSIVNEMIAHHLSPRLQQQQQEQTGEQGADRRTGDENERDISSGSTGDDDEEELDDSDEGEDDEENEDGDGNNTED